MKRLLLVLLLVGCEESYEGIRYYPERADVLLAEVCECIGMCARQPIFLMVHDEFFEEYGAYTWFADGVVQVEEDHAEEDRVIKHELLHHVLARNGYPTRDNSNHIGDIWECAWVTSG